MGRFNGVLLASDFDCTLTDRSGKIPQRNIDAVKYFISEGGRFTVSTGRAKEGFHKYSPELINAPVLLANGAAAYDYGSGAVIFEYGIGSEDIPVLLAVTEKYPCLCVEFFSCGKGAFALNPDEETFLHFKGLGFDFSELDEITADFFPCAKIMLGSRKNTPEIQAYLRGIDMGNMFYIPSSGSYIEILSKKAGKGRGLLRLADILGIEHKNTYAVGDGSNDADMLKAAALGFAPEDGDEFALNSADAVVCGSGSGAVAGAIEALCSIYR